VQAWNREGSVVLVAQLGDLIDVKNGAGEGSRDGGTSDSALEAVKAVLAGCDCRDVVHVIGNHELYNYSRARLEQVLEVRRGGPTTWHTFLPLPGARLRIVVLDSYHVSTIQGCTEADTEAAFAYLGQRNPNDITKFGTDWSRGLAGLARRFMPYNGLVGPEQLAWLEAVLAAAEQAGEKVVLLSHVPLCPAACDPLCLLWNYEEV
jgi:manganese-dependent ADP-ribose/CDP-alcohol diphosphatase